MANDGIFAIGIVGIVLIFIVMILGDKQGNRGGPTWLTHPTCSSGAYTAKEDGLRWLIRLTCALLESQGELLPLAQDAEQYYNNRMGDCACYRSCKHCESWDKKQRAAREVIARAERVRRGEV